MENQKASQQQAAIHPCQQCGACCAFFRVSFYWREGEEREHAQSVPKGLWEEEVNSLQRTMKGTGAKHHPKCIALKGNIGNNVECTIYERRSSTCRSFLASYENGQRNVRCEEARAAHGLRPLNKDDWKRFLRSIDSAREKFLGSGAPEV